jgi:hypothetical protein
MIGDTFLCNVHIGVSDDTSHRTSYALSFFKASFQNEGPE